MHKKTKALKDTPRRNAPIHIPLDFENAIDGLLAVNPAEPVESKREPEKKPKDKAKKKPVVEE